MRGMKHRVARTRLVGGALAAAWLGLGAAGCAWVEISEEGRAVQAVTPDKTAGCEFLGKTNASTKDRVVFERSQSNVASELEVLARNSAARMGGDTVTAVGPVVEGRREFHVYRCAGRDR